MAKIGEIGEKYANRKDEKYDNNLNSNMQNYFSLTGRGIWLNSKEEIDRFFSSKTHSIAPFILNNCKTTYFPYTYFSGIKWLDIVSDYYYVIGWSGSKKTELCMDYIKTDLSEYKWRVI